LYYGSLNNASQSNDYQNADDLVESLNGFQKKFGSKVRPVNKITAEIFTINMIYFKTALCLLTAILMLLFTVIEILKKVKR
jgi:hypothetical protein